MGNICVHETGCHTLTPLLTTCKHLLFYAEKIAHEERICLQNSLGGGAGGGGAGKV